MTTIYDPNKCKQACQAVRLGNHNTKRRLRCWEINQRQQEMPFISFIKVTYLNIVNIKFRLTKNLPVSYYIFISRNIIKILINISRLFGQKVNFGWEDVHIFSFVIFKSRLFAI